jgi:peptidoglycan/xylan/chitin deacetylase (PgdA/CDA1 family)
MKGAHYNFILASILIFYASTGAAESVMISLNNTGGVFGHRCVDPPSCSYFYSLFSPTAELGVDADNWWYTSNLFNISSLKGKTITSAVYYAQTSDTNSYEDFTQHLFIVNRTSSCSSTIPFNTWNKNMWNNSLYKNNTDDFVYSPDTWYGWNIASALQFALEKNMTCISLGLRADDYSTLSTGNYRLWWSNNSRLNITYWSNSTTTSTTTTTTTLQSLYFTPPTPANGTVLNVSYFKLNSTINGPLNKIVLGLDAKNYTVFDKTNVKCRVAINFDDGYKSSIQTAKPILDAYGFDATVYIITSDVESYDNSNLNLSDLSKLYAAGWDISSHTVEHPHLTALSAAELDDELKDSRDYLINNGFQRTARIIAYPYGDYSHDVVDAAKKYYSMARTVDMGTNSQPMTDDDDAFLKVDSVELQNTTSLSDIKYYIDTAIAQKTFLVLTFHDIIEKPSQWCQRPSILEGAASYLKNKSLSGELEVVTMSQYYDLTHPVANSSLTTFNASSYRFYANVSGLTPGKHTYFMKATDAYGNTRQTDNGSARVVYNGVTTTTTTSTTTTTTMRSCGAVAHATNPLSISTYEGGNQSTHPDVYFNASKWNGYEYWMVLTPLPNDDDYYENPSIYRSSDGLNWTNGITNPIDAFPGGTYHNADPSMTYVNGMMYAYWVTVNATNNINRMKSSNGLTWSDKTTVLTGTLHHFYSPSVVYRNGVWMMWGINSSTGCSSKYGVLNYYNSTDGVRWAGPYNTDFEYVDNYAMWHINVKWDYSTRNYWMIYTAYKTTVANPACDEYTNLYYANSSDGITWTSYTTPLICGDNSGWDATLYETAFYHNSTTDDFKIWYSAYESPVWNIGYTNQSWTNVMTILGSSAETPSTTTTITSTTTTTSTTSTTLQTMIVESNLYVNGNLEVKGCIKFNGGTIGICL